MRTGALLDAEENLLYTQCYAGELYVVDAATGETALEWQQPFNWMDRSDEGQSPSLAGNVLVTHRNSLRTYLWQPGRRARPVGKGLLECEWTRDIIERRLTWQEYKHKWFDRGYFWLWRTSRNWCEPFFQGNRIYIRTDDAMYCICDGADGD
jgi:hypothetical protein